MFARRFLLAVASALMVANSALPSRASAQSPMQDGSRTFVEKLADRAVATLTIKDITEQERARRFRALLTEAFDVPAIARFALGRYWREATEQQRAEYLRLFETMIVATYASRFGEYSSETIRLLDARIDDPKLVTVMSEVFKPGQAPARVDWRVMTDSGSYRVVDVVVEGISMSLTQRNDFAAVIQRTGGAVEGLLVALRDKTKQFE